MRLAWLLVVPALTSASAHSAPLTYAAALDLAARFAPSLQSRTADIEAAQSSAVAAGRLPDPKIRLGLDNFPVSGPPAGRFGPDSMTMATVGLQQDMPNNAKRQAERERAAANTGAAEADAAMEARNVRLQTALAWIDLHAAKQRLTALDQAEQVVEAMIAAAPPQMSSGGLRPAQAIEPELVAAALGDRHTELVATQIKARAILAQWTGDPQADTAGDVPVADIDAAALNAGLNDLPSLRVIDARLSQAQADVSLAKAGARSDWTWDLAYQHRDPRWGDMISAGVTFSLPVFAKTKQNPIIAGRLHAEAGVRSQKEAAHRELEAQLKTDLADHAMHHARLVRARETLVPLAERRAQLETTSYAGGGATLSDALAAQLAAAEARIDAIDRDAAVERDAVRITLTYGADPR